MWPVTWNAFSSLLTIVPDIDSVHIIIPDYDGWDQTKICLQALRDSTYKSWHTIVVDHGLSDATANGLRAMYPGVTRLSGGTDLWWTGATNLGIRWAMGHGATHIMLLNNDCYVAPDTTKRLVAHMQQTGEAIIAAVQRDYATKQVLYDTASACLLLGFTTFMSPRVLSKSSRQKTLLPTKLVIGGRGVLIPASVFERIGLFDEEALPHYGADHDFYLRARQQGVPLLTALDAIVYVDNRKTTLARRLGTLSFAEFRSTLSSRRSHRNLKDLNALFKKHYPLKGLHHVGVTLNLMRYVLIYLCKRASYLLFARPG